MSSNNSQTTMLVVVGLMGCCCIASIAVAVYLYMNPEAWEWVKEKFNFGDNNNSNPVTPPGPDVPPPDTGDAAAGPPPEDDGDDGGGNGNNNNNNNNGGDNNKGNCADQGTCTNNTGQYHFCSKPWQRKVVKYSKDGKTVKCCKKKSSKFSSGDCTGSTVVALPRGSSKSAVDKIHEQLEKYEKKLWGPVVKQWTCPCGAGSDHWLTPKMTTGLKLDTSEGWRIKCISNKNGSVRTCKPTCNTGYSVGEQGGYCKKSGAATQNIKWVTA